MTQIIGDEKKVPPPLRCQCCHGAVRLIGSERDPLRSKTDLLTFICVACGSFLVFPVGSPAND